MKRMKQDLKETFGGFEHRAKEVDAEEKNLKSRRTVENGDIFSWMKLPTKYPNLKSRLREKLIELLTEV